nr:MAG TPA: KELCH-LIKE PROTEIN 2, SERINE/THREONINE-PROTEIN KINASE PROTEIN-TRANSFERASE COMPLEX, KLHL3, UBIQUITIN [Caudoviricetes sp.]
MASAFWLLLAGAGIADGKASVLQTKSYSIKQNGNYAFTPDAGYDGFSSVNVSVNVETKLQEKSVTPTKQEQTIVPDTGYDGLSKLVVGAIPASYIDTSSANATSPDILAPKTAFVKGELVTGTMQEYDGSVTNGTEGMKPQLNAPTISVSGRQLTINNPSTNGNFTEGYKIFVDGVEKSEQTANTLDLYSYFDEDGTYQLSVAAAAAQFADSNQSAKATYAKVQQVGNINWFATQYLSTARGRACPSKIGKYSLFAGGQDHWNFGPYYATVDVVDDNLSISQAASLPVANSMSIGATLPNYALICGGVASNTAVICYNEDLVQSQAEALSVQYSQGFAASNGTYALIAGSINSDSSKVVNAYDNELVRYSPADMTNRHFGGGAACAGKYFICMGGSQPAEALPDVYDEELTHTNAADLPVVTYDGTACSVGIYAIWAGGYKSGVQSYVYAYDDELTIHIATRLPQAVEMLASCTLNNNAIIGGGHPSSKAVSNVCTYDVNLTQTAILGLSVARSDLSAISNGQYAFFAGGRPYLGSPDASNVIDVYTVKE